MTKALKNASSGLFYKALKKVSNIKDDRSALYQNYKNISIKKVSKFAHFFYAY